MPPIDTIESRENNSSNVPMQKIAIEIIQQSIDLINKLQDDQYTHPSKVMPAGTIGKHIRHVYDHFNLLYDSCHDTSSDWILDYDIRARNNPSETDRSIAINNLNQLQKRISENNNIPLQSQLTLLAAIDASDKNKYQFDSSFGRELLYSCIHAIHHYASVKAICIELGIDVPEEFGMAPSTLQDQQKLK